MLCEDRLISCIQKMQVCGPLVNQAFCWLAKWLYPCHSLKIEHSYDFLKQNNHWLQHEAFLRKEGLRHCFLETWQPHGVLHLQGVIEMVPCAVIRINISTNQHAAALCTGFERFTQRFSTYSPCHWVQCLQSPAVFGAPMTTSRVARWKKGRADQFSRLVDRDSYASIDSIGIGKYLL